MIRSGSSGAARSDTSCRAHQPADVRHFAETILGRERKNARDVVEQLGIERRNSREERLQLVTSRLEQPLEGFQARVRLSALDSRDDGLGGMGAPRELALCQSSVEAGP